MKGYFLSFVLLFFVFSCEPTKKKMVKLSSPLSDTLLKSATTMNVLEERLKKIPKDTVPVWGYRFVIKGDYDGDGKKEKLIEHYFSTKTNTETPKFYDGLDYEQQVDVTCQKDPQSFALSDDRTIDTLHIASSCQVFGISYMKNEGDLNGDGTDEISYVVDWADWSNLNTWHIVTYNKKWEKLYSFHIWDWQLPSLPASSNEYGLFGTEKKKFISNETLNQQTEQELISFKGLVKKIKTNKIQVIYRGEDAEMDTMVVDLRKLPSKK